MSNETRGFAAIARTFSNRDFAVFTAGNGFSLIGLWVLRLAVGWLAWDMTKSGFWLGAVAFADLFPVVLVGPFAGVLADRVDRRTIILIGKTLSLLQAVVLTTLTLLGGMTIGALFLLTLFNGIVIGIQQPARMAIVPELVRPEDLGSAVGINSVVFNLARFIGPAIAGALLESLGVASAFAFTAVSSAAVVVSVLAIPPLKAPPGRHRGVMNEIADGIQYAFSHRLIAPLLWLSLGGSILVRPVYELLPGFVDAVFARGAGGLAILTSSVGIGAVVAGLWLAQRGAKPGLTAISMWSFLLSGVFSLAFAVIPEFWTAAAALAASGATMVLSASGAQTVLQKTVVGHMRGRVLSIWGIIFRGGPAIGAFAMGWLSTRFGLMWPVAVGGILFAAMALLALRHRKPTGTSGAAEDENA